MDVNLYLAKRYPSPPCWCLAADVLAMERGVAVDAYRTISDSVRSSASEFRLVLHKDQHGFQRIDSPVDFAVVLLGKSAQVGIHHCGIYYAGKVLHALDAGNLYQDLASLGDEYRLMEFWARS